MGTHSHEEELLQCLGGQKDEGGAWTQGVSAGGAWRQACCKRVSLWPVLGWQKCGRGEGGPQAGTIVASPGRLWGHSDPHQSTPAQVRGVRPLRGLCCSLVQATIPVTPFLPSPFSACWVSCESRWEHLGHEAGSQQACAQTLPHTIHTLVDINLHSHSPGYSLQPPLSLSKDTRGKSPSLCGVGGGGEEEEAEV